MFDTSSGTPDFRCPRIEFWYEFASTYSYLSVMRIEALAQQRGVFGAPTFFVGDEMF